MKVRNRGPRAKRGKMMSWSEPLRRAALGALGASGLAGLARRSKPFTDRAVILAYHSVARAPDYASPAITVDPGVFEAQIAHLARRYNIVPLKDVIDPLAAGRALDNRSVAITFDDGYADNVEIALPILERYGAPATFFVTVDPVTQGAPFWVARLERAVRSARDPRALGAVLAERLTLEIAPTDAGQAFNAVSRLINRASGDERRALIARAEASLREAGALLPDAPDAFMARPEQLARLVDAGMEVGAHSRTHPILASLPDAEIRSELADGRARLEALLDQPVTSLAYPNGRGVPINFDQRVMELARQAGYARAVTSQRGPALEGLDPLAVPRMAVNARLGARGFVWKLERAFRAAPPEIPRDAGLWAPAAPPESAAI